MTRGSALFRERLAAFGAGAQGLAALEFALVAPFMVLLFLGVATYFVAIRQDYSIKRATYTASDMISRQKTVDGDFLANVRAMAQNISRAKSQTIGFRASSIVRGSDGLFVAWSYATPPYAKREPGDAPAPGLPDVQEGESVIFVETATDVRPLFGLFGTTLERRQSVSIARPRLVRQIAKTD